MLKALFDRKQEYLNSFFSLINHDLAEEFLHRLESCGGIIAFTGVGKSGVIAEKIALTMTSVGVRAIHLSPMNALHGDIGLLTSKDLVVMLSKSGESEELLNLMPFVKHRGIPVLSIVSNGHSRIAKTSDFAMVLPIERELCPFNLSPTTSSTSQLIFGDVMAMALMQRKQLTLDAYAMNHPAGTIGKKITLRVQDLMLKGSQLPLCKPEDRLIDVLVELSNKKAGCVIVVDDDQKLLGIFTDGDLRRALVKTGQGVLNSCMEQLMTKNPRSITSDALAWEALVIMESKNSQEIQCLIVVNHDHRVVGLIKLHDIIQAGLSHTKQ